MEIKVFMEGEYFPQALLMWFAGNNIKLWENLAAWLAQDLKLDLLKETPVHLRLIELQNKISLLLVSAN